MCSSSTRAHRRAPPTSSRSPRLRRHAGRRLAGVVGRAAREPARGPVGGRPGQAGQGHHRQQLFDYYLGWLTDPSVTNHYQLGRRLDGPVRPRVGDEGRDRGPPPGRQAGAEARRQGRPRRPLARRLDHHRLRDLGLQRQGRGEGPLRPRLHRRRQQPDAGHRRDATPASRTSTGSPWLAFGGIPAPLAGLFNVVGRPARTWTRTADGELQALGAPAGEPQAAGPATNGARTATRSTPRPRRRRSRRPGAPRPPRGERRPARVGRRRRAHPDPALRRHVLRHRGSASTAPPGITRCG